MTAPRKSLMVAVANNQVIGRNNDLPWRLSSDLKRFKELTMGHPIIMGRKTYESIGRPLPGRQNIVVTRQPDLQFEGVTMASSLAAACAACPAADELFIIGGAALFAEGLASADRVYFTRVEAEPEGDVYFPVFPTDDWHCISEQAVPADEKNEYPTRFQIWERQ